MHATVGEDRTLRRTHISQCCALDRRSSHAPTTCFISHSLMCLTHFLPFCSTSPPSAPTALPMTGIRKSPCATPLDGQSGHLADSFPLTSYEPKTCINVSEHAPINILTRRNSFNIDVTVAARTPTVFRSEWQPAAAHNSSQQEM